MIQTWNRPKLKPEPGSPPKVADGAEVHLRRSNVTTVDLEVLFSEYVVKALRALGHENHHEINESLSYGT